MSLRTLIQELTFKLWEECEDFSHDFSEVPRDTGFLDFNDEFKYNKRFLRSSTMCKIILNMRILQILLKSYNLMKMFLDYIV